MLVFDGRHCREEESGLSYANPLEIAYTAKGQTADEYIVEKLEWKDPKMICTVVSNDQGLCRHAQALRVKTQSNEAFLRYLEKKKPRKREKAYEPKESPKEMERLLKIFESKKGFPED